MITPHGRRSLSIPCSKNADLPQSISVLVHGVRSMQVLKATKEFRTVIVNEESLDALLEIKEYLEILSAR